MLIRNFLGGCLIGFPFVVMFIIACIVSPFHWQMLITAATLLTGVGILNLGFKVLK